jgi:hypothetical protein
MLQEIQHNEAVIFAINARFIFNKTSPDSKALFTAFGSKLPGILNTLGISANTFQDLQKLAATAAYFYDSLIVKIVFRRKALELFPLKVQQFPGNPARANGFPIIHNRFRIQLQAIAVRTLQNADVYAFIVAYIVSRWQVLRHSGKVFILGEPFCFSATDCTFSHFPNILSSTSEQTA